MASLSIYTLTVDGQERKSGSQLGHYKLGKILLWLGPRRKQWRCEKWSRSRCNVMVDPTGFTDGLNVV